MPSPVVKFDFVDDQTAAVLRQKSEAERLQIAHGMWRSANQMIRSVVQSEHPDWTADQVQRETARRLLRGEFVDVL